MDCVGYVPSFSMKATARVRDESGNETNKKCGKLLVWHLHILKAGVGLGHAPRLCSMQLKLV